MDVGTIEISRRFTEGLEDGGDVYGLFEWAEVDVLLKDHSTGRAILDMPGLEFPKNFSQSACDIIASKYFRKKGVYGHDKGEISMRQVVHRMVRFWTDALVDEGVFEQNSAQSQIFYDEVAYMLLAQIFAPNSPQWFNTGLGIYDIKGNTQGHYYVDAKTGELCASQDAYSRTQGSACFIISVQDSLIGEKSLTQQLTTETLLFKYGSGVGTNWSPIRSKSEFLSGGGRSSGLLSFLKVSDKNAGAIKSGGTTRRAAKMNILNMDHPEILDFIMWKAKEEDKAVALGRAGYSTAFEGEAYETVSGQNANNSVRLTDEFMRLVNTPDAPWHTKGRVDGSRDRSFTTGELWNAIAQAAHRCADPGVQFDDTINSWHTCPAGEDGELSPENRINASNPCSEYMFLDDTACNLASINITKFYDHDSDSFRTGHYIQAISLIQLVLEATIHWGQFPTEHIARRSHLFRTTGLGLTNMGSLLMQLALPYDSDEARDLAAALTSIMTAQSYATSALLAERVGSFSCYPQNKEHMRRVITNHARAASSISVPFEGMSMPPVCISASLPFGLRDTLDTAWQDAIRLGDAYGYRNAQVSVYAPTGTIALAMDCSTTSSEPYFSHVSFKKLVGGNAMTFTNPDIQTALRRLKYTDTQIDEITAYILRKDPDGNLIDGKIEGAPHLREEHLSIFDTANTCGTGVRFISPEGHVKMMGALSSHVSGGISKTVNLPNSATLEDIKHVYKLSWELGVKAIAVYRDGCKASQPLSTTPQATADNPEKNTKPTSPTRIKPYGIRTARVHEAAIEGLKLYITTSYYEDGRLGEVYISSGRQGTLTKGLLESLSTTISEMLQYGVPASDIARMYRGQKFEPSGYVTGHPYIKFADSISDLISKIIDIELGNFSFVQVSPNSMPQKSKFGISGDPTMPQKPKFGVSGATHHTGATPQGAPPHQSSYTLYGETCANCSSSRMIRNGTCKVCTDCGATTGCS